MDEMVEDLGPEGGMCAPHRCSYCFLCYHFCKQQQRVFTITSPPANIQSLFNVTQVFSLCPEMLTAQSIVTVLAFCSRVSTSLSDSSDSVPGITRRLSLVESLGGGVPLAIPVGEHGPKQQSTVYQPS